MTEEQRVELLTFLKDWLAWVERGAPHHQLYCRAFGLCGNSEKLATLIEKRLKEDGLCRTYPFGKENYYRRYGRRTQHECPKRLAWVRKTIEELDREP